eukprot:scaffold1647_cov32-Prasinocladus_malaysianus.AAC.1
MPAEEFKGFTLHFYGEEPSREQEMINVKAALEHIASERGIKVVVHRYTPHERLLAHLCRARGNVVFPRSDMNPRAAYEGLPAGNPVYVNEEAMLPQAFLDL